VEQSRQVHQKEDYASRFLVTERTDEGAPEFWLFETCVKRIMWPSRPLHQADSAVIRYTSDEGQAQHVTEPHFKAMISTLESEGILRKPPQVVKTTTTAGFDLDRDYHKG
jgi:hypothetical protein